MSKKSHDLSVPDANLLPTEEVVQPQPKEEAICHAAMVSLMKVEENQIDSEVLFWVNRKQLHVTEDQLFG